MRRRVILIRLTESHASYPFQLLQIRFNGFHLLDQCSKLNLVLLILLYNLLVFLVQLLELISGINIFTYTCSTL